MNNIYFKLFSNCVPVKGVLRSTICDLQRNHFDFIPNDLFHLLEECKIKPIEQIKATLAFEDIEVVDEYFDFLIKKDYGFWCSEIEMNLFPQIDLKFKHPSIITNAIIDVDYRSSHDYNSIFKQLEDLGCSHLQIRFFSETSLQNLNSIIKLLTNNRIVSLELVVQASEELTEEALILLCKKNLKIIHIVVSGSNFNRTMLAGIDSYTSLTFIKESIDSCGSCGNIHYAFFVVNLQAFAESKSFNSCLNRKISIDISGNIKNCPSMRDSFGCAKSVQLIDVIKNPEFIKIWGVHKEQIQECMDCEFRHICTDCRAYTQQPSDPYSKPQKCGYNPYTASWDNSNTHV